MIEFHRGKEFRQQLQCIDDKQNTSPWCHTCFQKTGQTKFSQNGDVNTMILAKISTLASGTGAAFMRFSNIYIYLMLKPKATLDVQLGGIISLC